MPRDLDSLINITLTQNQWQAKAPTLNANFILIETKIAFKCVQHL